MFIITPIGDKGSQTLRKADGVQRVKPDLRTMIETAPKESDPDNPIYRVAKGTVMREVVTDDKVENYILEKLDKLESRFSELSSCNQANRIVIQRTESTDLI